MNSDPGPGVWRPTRGAWRFGPGARRSASRSTCQTFPSFTLFLDRVDLVWLDRVWKTQSILQGENSTFWSGGLWRVQPGGVHRVHHRGDDPGSEGRPGDKKSQFSRWNNLVETEFFYQTMHVAGGGWGFHPADLRDEPNHHHWAEGETRMRKSGKGTNAKYSEPHVAASWMEMSWTEYFASITIPQIRKCAKRCGSPRHHSGRTPTASEYLHPIQQRWGHMWYMFFQPTIILKKRLLNRPL